MDIRIFFNASMWCILIWVKNYMMKVFYGCL